MPKLRTSAALALAAIGLIVPTATAHALDPVDGPGPVVARSGIPFLGANGLLYDPSPAVVLGNEGRVFYGQEFDAACSYGRDLDAGLSQLAKLARVIERSGRHVVFSVAPNKSAVSTDDLPGELPHGECDSRGIKEQNRVLDRFTDPAFVPLREKLERQAARGANVYWRLDTHWTTVAASELADGVARRLNPSLADLQSYRTERQTIPVDIGALVGQAEESGRVHVPTTDVKVRPAGGSPAYDPATAIEPKLQWRTGPAKRTWRGNTVLLGDSFSYRGLSVLMPLFRHGRFLWLNAVPNEDLIAAIPTSDTVVIEIVQRYVGVSILVQTDFRKAVKRALRDYDGRN